MRNASLLVVAAVSLFIFSCAPDKKETAPDLDERDGYVGDWVCNELSVITGTTTYPVTISKSTANKTDISINRFYDIENQAVRVVVAGNTFSIPFQELKVVSGFSKGSGTLSSSKTTMSLAYTTTVSANRDTCRATYTKR